MLGPLLFTLYAPPILNIIVLIKVPNVLHQHLHWQCCGLIYSQNKWTKKL